VKLKFIREKTMKFTYLGKDSYGREYYRANDNYVYQFKDGKNCGWFCSVPAWKRALHKVID
jgi:hypothetical protein